MKLLLLLAATACLAADDSQLLATRDRVWRAWFAGDEATLRQLVPEQAIAISAGEREWKRQAQIIAQSRAFHSHGGRLTHLVFPRTEIQHYGDVAIIFSSYRLETEEAGKRSASSGRVLEVFVYQHGRWLNPGWHTDQEKE
jgi:ketosteroid isomerase-like protein